MHIFYGADGAAHVILSSTNHSEASINLSSAHLRVQFIYSHLFFAHFVTHPHHVLLLVL